MNEEPDWAKVLNEAYQSKVGVVQWRGSLPEDHPHHDEEPDHDLQTATNLTVTQIHDAIVFLERTDLIRQIGTGMNYELSKKGLDVAHERTLRDRQERLMETQNEATGILASFTVILGAAALIQAITAVVNTQNPYNLYLSVVFAVLLIAIWKTKNDWMPTT